MAHWISTQSQLKWVKDSETCILCDVNKRNPPPKSNNVFFNRNNKTCWIRGWFEQLCSYSSWRVIAFNAFKVRAIIMALPGFKGLDL